jgi:hypothetical protein
MEIPKIVTKVQDNIAVNLEQGETLSLDQLASLAGPFGVSPVVTVMNTLLPSLVFKKVFDLLNSNQIQNLINLALQNDASYVSPQFQNFLQIDCPPGFDTELLVNTLKSWAGVIEWAHTVSVEDANVIGTTNPFFNQQLYLSPAPVGIGVQSAWLRGADGANVRFIDIEQAWFLLHEDLPQNIPLLHGQIRPTDQGHGTAVLGVVTAIDNNIGVVGISPQANASLISVFNTAAADEIMLATSILSPGDVILLEFTVGGGRPAELNPEIFEAIKLATLVGVIVVEAAGNINLDLDTVVDDAGRRVLSRLAPAEFKESGAILVGACRSAVPHSKWQDSLTTGSNFGSRIDCHAWGENVFTSGLQISNPSANSYFNFSGTSSASAIIAGVCVLIQDLQKRIGFNPGFPFSPMFMRQIVNDPANGTPSFSIFDRIGSMPDLNKIVANVF